jgi:hypothetical protein
MIPFFQNLFSRIFNSKPSELSEEEANLNEENLLNTFQKIVEDIVYNITNWNPTEEVLLEIAKMLPDLSTATTAEVSHACVEVQRKYIWEPFIKTFENKLYEFRYEIASLSDADRYHRHYMHVHVFQTLLVKSMSSKTSHVVNAAYEITEKAKLQKDTVTTWATWEQPVGIDN